MAQPRYIVSIIGPCASDTAASVISRLAEVERLTPQPIQVVDEYMQTDPEDHVLVYEANKHDTVSFSVEKILDMLAAEGWISLEMTILSQEEEELIRQRLQGLGYIE